MTYEFTYLKRSVTVPEKIVQFQCKKHKAVCSIISGIGHRCRYLGTLARYCTVVPTRLSECLSEVGRRLCKTALAPGRRLLLVWRRGRLLSPSTTRPDLPPWISTPGTRGRPAAVSRNNTAPASRLAFLVAQSHSSRLFVLPFPLSFVPPLWNHSPPFLPCPQDDSFSSASCPTALLSHLSSFACLVRQQANTFHFLSSYLIIVCYGRNLRCCWSSYPIAQPSCCLPNHLHSFFSNCPGQNVLSNGNHVAKH